MASKAGRKPSGPYSSKNSVFSARLTEATRRSLEWAKDQSGRSLSQEVEVRLRRSFDEDRDIRERFGSKETYALLRLIALVIEIENDPHNAPKAARRAPRSIDAGKPRRRTPLPSWLTDSRKFDQTVAGINFLLSQFRPPGTIDESLPVVPETDHIGLSWQRAFVVAAETEGPHIAQMIVEELKGRGRGIPPVRGNKSRKEIAQLAGTNMESLIARLNAESASDQLTRLEAEAGRKFDLSRAAPGRTPKGEVNS